MQTFLQTSGRTVIQLLLSALHEVKNFDFFNLRCVCTNVSEPG